MIKLLHSRFVIRYSLFSFYLRVFRSYLIITLLFYLGLIILPAKAVASEPEKIHVDTIMIQGNSTTKSAIIFRELTFFIDDSLVLTALRTEIKASVANLLNTSLFNFVTVDTSFIGSRVSVTFQLEERWYIWPYPILEHADRNLSAFIYSKDIDRINYGSFFVWNNFRGRREIVKVKARFGYKEQFAIIYNKPYLDKNKRFGIEIGLAKFRQKQIAVASYDNKLSYYMDLDKNRYVQQSVQGHISLSHRERYYNFERLLFGYNNVRVIDEVVSNNNDYLLDGLTSMQYYFLHYQFLREKRDNIIYPLTGYFAYIGLDKTGLGTVQENKIDQFDITVKAAKYFQLTDHVFFSTYFSGKISKTGTDSYILNKALGYDEFLRGYENYVIDGTAFTMGKANIKYLLVKTRIRKINFLPFAEFNKIHYTLYLNMYYETGYVDDKVHYKASPMANRQLQSFGVGFDFVTYYDYVLRLEYSYNDLKESGFYIHLGTAF